MTADADLPRWTRVAAYALATDGEGRMLVVRVAAGYPGAGFWTLPGGGLSFGEDPDSGALRELTEETGLVGEVTSLAFVNSVTGPSQGEHGFGEWHGIRIVYRVQVTGGELRDELDESTDTAAWFARSELDGLLLGDLVTAALEHLEGGR